MLKKLIPKSIKHFFRKSISALLNLPYNRFSIPNEITDWLPLESKINTIDIGASEGNFFHRIAQSYQINRGVLIEPLANRIIELKKRFNGHPNYDIIECAVSSTDGEATFYVSPEFDYVSSLLNINDEELKNHNINQPKATTVQTHSLDYIYKNAGMELIDFLKIDVQGFELEVLKSGINALAKTKVVYIEASFKPLYVNSCTLFDVYSFMYTHQFKLVNVEQGYKSADGELFQCDCLFINKLYL
ncbi:MAG: FkbM family methyltransferase [Flavobacterium sp.]|uniref:FkbM family methyltransferase n=1 Tax=Pedobacter agri TaxID=454586 RepID=UPI001202D36F|nr:FkbM family methyltransferase [Pedobacter agri]MDQ1141883.1 FkbM family methyltransferase [Pedobacter agri]RZJ54669.1 MAG: FkbM family methyltransferase [Flavobacterium sp.]